MRMVQPALMESWLRLNGSKVLLRGETHLAALPLWTFESNPLITEEQMQDIRSEVHDGPLAIASSRFGTTHTLEIRGELELSTAPTFSAQLEAALGDGADVIVLDLSGLEFIDSMGIALLVEAHQRLNGEAADRLLLIESMAPAVRRVMAVTGLQERLSFIREADAPGGPPGSA